MDDSRRKSFRAGNQLGKSFAGLRWLLDLAAGRHPKQFREPPLECWIVCTSWSQSVAIMGKFHALLDDVLVDHEASSNYSTRAAYGKDNPAVVFKNGSVVRFRTTRQGPTALQGSTIHVALLDEPPTLGIYQEVDRRLLRTGGRLGMCFTPAHVPCGWIKDLTDKGVISETHAKLTVENLTPLGCDEPLRLLDNRLMDQEWIDEQWRATPEIYADVVLDGAWEGRPVGRFFKTFDPAIHAQARALSPGRGPVRLVLGIDHAAAGREFGQCAVLAQVQQFRTEDERTREAVNVMDEVVMVGSATSEEFGRQIVSMLARHGIRWSDLWRAYGDIPASSRVAYKGNQELERAIARATGAHVYSLRPRIKGAKEGRGAAGLLDAGCRYIYAAISDQLLNVHPRAAHTIDGLNTWDMSPSHPKKDVCDALRYALKDFAVPFHQRNNVGVRIG
jgi:phage terminase large subunit-like protein